MNRPIDVPLVGDLRGVVPQLVDALKENAARAVAPTSTFSIKKDAEELAQLAENAPTGRTPIHPARFVVEATKAFPKDGIMMRDGGATVIFQWTYSQSKPHDVIWNQNFGHLGTGLPYAVGASIAEGRKRPVMLLTSDSSFLFHIAELETAARQNLPLVCVVGVDHQWGLEVGVYKRTFEPAARRSPARTGARTCASTRSPKASAATASTSRRRTNGPGHRAGLRQRQDRRRPCVHRSEGQFGGDAEVRRIPNLVRRGNAVGKGRGMREYLKFYIDGQWVDPVEPKSLDVDNPTTEQVSGRIALGAAADVDKAVKAARKAFATWSQTTREERLDVLQAILAEYQKRAGELADAVTEEMGAPASLAAGPQVGLGIGHLATAIDVLKNFEFAEQHGSTLVVKEPIGVCGLITPWNWPINQIACKVYPALATGCTMVLKPSEVAPYSAQIFTEIIDAAGVPAGVYNLVYGDGPGVGVALSSHPDIDMVSFTGSTRAGVDVAKNAAPTVKRVTQELGGKSPNIVLDDEDFAKSVVAGVSVMMMNSGQSCNAPSRMLVPNSRKDEAVAVAKATAEQVKVGDPNEKTAIGPVASKAQFDKIQGLLQKGIDEGATVVVGGPGRPDGLDTGYYVKPTVFADVTNDMTIAREEIFGPVLCILGYDDLDQALEIANDTDYGLAGYVSAADLNAARAVARRIRAGSVAINHAFDMNAPFGGYKRSGNGREWSEFGFHEYLEIKSALGYAPESS